MRAALKGRPLPISGYRSAADDGVAISLAKSAHATGAPWIGTIRATSSFSVRTSL